MQSYCNEAPKKQFFTRRPKPPKPNLDYSQKQASPSVRDPSTSSVREVLNELKLDVITELAKQLPFDVVRQVLAQMNESIVRLELNNGR